MGRVIESLLTLCSERICRNTDYFLSEDNQCNNSNTNKQLSLLPSDLFRLLLNRMIALNKLNDSTFSLFFNSNTVSSQNLRDITLGRVNARITDRSLEVIRKCCPSIRKLSLYDCVAITEHGLNQFIQVSSYFPISI